MPSIRQEDAVSIAAGWLAKFTRTAYSHDADAFASAFMSNGWLRDVLTFTWDTRSLRGREAIARYLATSDRLNNAALSNIVLSTDSHYRPRFSSNENTAVEAGFTFETHLAIGRGYVHLRQDEDGDWLALTLGMIVCDLKGHEEYRCVDADWERLDRTWGQYTMEVKESVETQPYVLIVGGGQAGLQLAARCRQMRISALVIEQNERPGDHWSQRYSSLALHTISAHHQLLYQPYPSSWPEFTPRDKFASWLDAYAVDQNIIIWTKSTLVGKPQYDPVRKAWDVVVNRDGVPVELHPAHIVLATGVLGEPHVPIFTGKEMFDGTVIHSSQFADARPFVGKDVVVIGAGNSSIDICQDLALGGVRSVTMVQRSSSAVLSRKCGKEDLETIFLPDQPAEVGDVKWAAIPLGFRRKIMINSQEEQWSREKELNDKLRRAGLKLNLGEDGEGVLLLVFERAGGYWIDKGATELFASGKIKVKQGIQPTALSKHTLIFADGSELPADAIIFCTGHKNIREVHITPFGADVMDHVSKVWGLDEEGEIQGAFRPTGHPGLWFAARDIGLCRFASKQLAILLKADQLGLHAPRFHEKTGGQQFRRYHSTSKAKL